MKTRFIRINDISEIDTSKITVYDFNNRYIDSNGNMYGLKYNKQTRKIDIIKLIRTPAKAAVHFQQHLINKKKNQTTKKDYVELIGFKKETASDDDYEGNDFFEIDEQIFNPDSFINRTIEFMQIHKERLHGIMMNIKNSNIIADTDRVNRNRLEDLFRNIDIDGIQRIEKVLNSHKEIKNYPRSISYYLSKLDNRGKKIFDTLDSNTRRMNLIYYYEMCHSIRNLYFNLVNILNDLEFFLESIGEDVSRDLIYSEKQFFSDATISFETTISEINNILEDNKQLTDYIYNPDNF